MIDEIRSQQARASDQCTEIMREVEAGNRRVKQFLAGQQDETEKQKTNLFSEMQASQGAATTPSQEGLALTSQPTHQFSVLWSLSSPAAPAMPVKLR